jgi:ribosome-binding ATPase YchF (GTP1/OBG family)
LSTTSQILLPQAAGIIHSDIERGFIKAETIGYQARSDLSNAGQILVK